LIAAPIITKKTDGKLDHEMHQPQRDKLRHFGMNDHADAAMGSFLIHSVLATANEVHNLCRLPSC
jgi:IS5 family transposase